MNLDEIKLPFLFNERFTLEKRLGSGGMGSVFKAHDQLLSKDIAIKLIGKHLLDKHIVRFQQEAKAVGKLKHRNIVEVYDFGQSKEGMFYLTMELIKGESLADLVQRKGRLSHSVFSTILEQILDGLSNAHANSVLHRDIKPSNIMLTWKEDDHVEAKLVDFGLAKFVNEDQNLTKYGAPVGSPYYISPEQVEGKELDERADIYSLGCLIYKILTGFVPFEEEDALATMAKRLEESPPPFSEKAPDLACPQELEKLVFKCLKRNPDERYRSIAQIKIEYGKLLNSLAQFELPESDDKDDKRSFQKILVSGGVILSLAALVAVSDRVFHEIEAVQKRGNEKLNETPEKLKQKQDVNMDLGVVRVPIEDAIKRDNQIELQREKKIVDTGSIEEKRNQAIIKITQEFKLSDTEYKGTDRPLPLSLFKKFSRAPKLYKLFLKGSNVDDLSMEYITRCKELISLDLSANEGISLDAFSKLKRLKKLRALDLAAMKLDDRYMNVIAGMPNLRDIDISNNGGISFQGTEKLKVLPRLERVFLGNIGLQEHDQDQSISIPNIVQFANSAKSLYHLGLKYDFSGLNRFEDFSKLINIEQVSLTLSKGVSGEFLKELLKIPNLNNLNLSETDISPKTLLLINQNPKLKALSLEKLKLTDKDLIYLLKLKHIERLDISRNSDLSKIAIENLKFMPSLKELDSRYTSKPGYFQLKDGRFYRDTSKDFD